MKCGKHHLVVDTTRKSENVEPEGRVRTKR